MKAILALLALLLAAACGQPATSAHIPAHATGAIVIESGWAGPTPNGVDVSAGYLNIANGTGVGDRLLSASSPRAREVQLHEMSMDSSQVMQMRQIDGVDVPAGGAVALTSGGTHLMFIGVTSPFVEGERIPVVLTFEHAGVINTTLEVRRDAPDHTGH